MKQKPEVTVDDLMDAEHIKHPSFGQISARRIQGGGDNHFYGSEFSHQHWIEVVISSSETIRKVGRDFHSANAELVRVAMTEAQWATFLSSMNVGDGVPCTLRRMAGKGYPEIERLETKEDFFKRSMAETVEDSVSKINELIDALNSDTVKLSKKTRSELVRLAEHARMEIRDNAPFVATQFGEHIETRVEEAKVSIAAYAGAVARGDGQLSVAADPAIPALSGPVKSEDDGS